MAPLTVEQAASLAGVSVRRLNQLQNEPDGPKNSEPARFDPAEFGQWLQRRYTGDSYQAERTRLTKAQADKAELEAAELARELVRAEDVKLTWGEMIAAVRAKLLSLPSKLAPQVAPPGRVAEAQALAEAMIYEALSELAGEGLPAHRGRTGGSGSGDAGTAAEADGESVGGSVQKAVKRVKRRTGTLAH